jgi:hypothetical protein
MTGTYPESPFRVEAPEFREFQPISEIEIAPGTENRVTDPKRWPCSHGDCDKSYGRPQEVSRHIRDKHLEITPKCFLCDFKWTRTEKIRKHLLFEHRGRFTVKQRRKIRRCRGLDDTLDYLEILEISLSRAVTCHECESLLHPVPSG